MPDNSGVSLFLCDKGNKFPQPTQCVKNANVGVRVFLVVKLRMIYMDECLV